MKKKPFFSIILPTFNREAFLPRAIQSVLNQSFQRWELIIVDDGSEDGTSALISSFSDKRIRYYFQANKGQGAATNAGIRLAKGKYICFLDSDDEFFPHHLERFHEAIKNCTTPVAMFRTLAQIRKKGATNQRITPAFKKNNLGRLGQSLFFATHFTGNLTLCIHHSIPEKLKFSESCTYWLDGHFEVRAASQFPLLQIEATTCWINLHDDNMTSPIIEMAGLENRMNQHFYCLQSLFKGYRAEIMLPEKERIWLERRLTCRSLLFYCIIALKNHYFRKAFQLFKEAHRKKLRSHCPTLKFKVLAGFLYYTLKK